jgi:hypothetical protein
MEIQNVLLAFEQDGDGVSKQEVNFAREVLYKARRQLTQDAQEVADGWLSANAAASARPSKAIRSNESFRFVQSWLEVARGYGGITAYDSKLLLSTLETRPSPVRVITVGEWVKSYPLSIEAKEVFARWLSRFAPATLPPELAQVLLPQLSGLLWLSESDRPVNAVCFPALPVWPLSKVQMRQLLNEPVSVTIDSVKIQDLFGWVGQALTSADPEERARGERFQTLKGTLEKNLSSLRAFKIGGIERDLILLGKLKTGVVCGIVTQVVET